MTLAPGEYSVKLELGSDGATLDRSENKLQFTVTAADPFDDGWNAAAAGLVLVRSDWDVA
jgi:hypothetical protein